MIFCTLCLFELFQVADGSGGNVAKTCKDENICLFSQGNDDEKTVEDSVGKKVYLTIFHFFKIMHSGN